MQNMHIVERNHIPPGACYVGESTPLILKACLGTCVGVALFDHQTNIGGLIHLLLDRPPAHSENFQQKKYATTGLPVFLEELIERGASVKNMSAWVAGGALVGPLEEGDLEFDIGGRTTDSVMDFLHTHQIKISKSETGGFFTCIMNLDMQSGECTIEPAGFEKYGSNKPVKASAAEEIINSISNLRPVPQVALKVLRLISEDSYEIGALSEEMRKDQILSARTIQLCNSVFFKKNNTIESMDHALVYLGQKNLMKFIISAAISAFFSQAGRGYSLCKGGMYHHAVGSAIIAEKIAEFTSKVDAALAYTAGLLHDIGKVVLDQFVEDASPLFYRHLFEEGANSVVAEKSIFGIDHREAGEILAQQWSFPESLGESIKFHHSPEDAFQHKDLVHIVYLADLLMSRFQVGLELERLNTDSLRQRLEILGLSIQSLAEIVDMIPLAAFQSSPQMMMDE